MKNVILSIAVLAAIGFTSCRKAYTCKCETSGGGSTSVVVTKELSKQSLKDARVECDRGDSKSATLSTECEIDL